MTLLFAYALAALLALSPNIYGTGSGAPCFQQELDAFTTNIPLYPEPYYTADRDIFGTSIAISGETMAVGSPWAYQFFPAIPFQPAVYVYVRNAGTWRLQQKVVSPEMWNFSEPNTFGFAVGLEGNTLVVGDPARRTTWIFERSAGAWSVASGGELSGETILGATNDFGHTVGVSGDRVVVGDSGAHGYIDPDPNLPPWQRERFPGSVTVFKRTNGVWALEQEIVPGTPPGALVLYPVAISGDTIAIFRGARLLILRYGLEGWAETQHLDINADDLFIGNAEKTPIAMNESHIVLATGKAAYVFQKLNGEWSLQTRIGAGAGSYFDGLWYFGLSAAIHADRFVISDLNSAHVYGLSAGEWIEQYEIDLGPFFNGPLGGYSPAMVALGDDAIIASDNFPPTFYPHFPGFGEIDLNTAPRAREVDYFSSIDVGAPFISTVTRSPAELWPPNHQMVDVTLSYQASDNCSDVTMEISVTSNEPETGAGSGDMAPDWEVVDDHHLRLRAERAGPGSGRTYTIRVTARDGSGNSSGQSTSVTVPHD
jgi:hypothetical protein